MQIECGWFFVSHCMAIATAILRRMVFIFGISGFVLGFLAGLFAIHHFLKAYPANQLVRDKSLRWTYGLAVWLAAALGSWLGVWLYDRTFTSL